MYNGTSNKWTKHFDFIIVDVICINVAFFLATLIYSGSGHMYNIINVDTLLCSVF